MKVKLVKLSNSETIHRLKRSLKIQVEKKRKKYFTQKFGYIMDETKMDLITVNNTIVKMRKAVIKAKIHVIRSLVKQIKSLKNKKVANDKMKNQNERKTERLTKELSILKRLKKDHVSKFALSNTQNFLPEINPEKAEIDEILTKRACIRLCNTPVLAKEVQQFRKKFPNWESELPKITKNLGVKQKRKDEKLREKRKEKTQQEQVQKDVKISAVVSKNNSTINDGAGSKTEQISDEDITESENVLEYQEDDSGGASSEDSESENDDEESNQHCDITEEKPVASRIEGQVVIQQLDLNELIENDTSDEEENFLKSQHPKAPKITKSKSITEVKDSFFLGADTGENESSNNEESDNDTMNADNFSTDIVVVNKHRNDFIDKGKYGNDRRNPHHHHNSERGSRGSKHHRGGFSRGTDRDRSRNFYDSSYSGSSDRGRGKNPRGASRSNNRNMHSRGSYKHVQERRDHRSNTFVHENKNNDLHPSWAAKKTQKINISNGIQGKKIIFDQDHGSDIAVPKVVDGKNLHPSWAAKKESNRAGIQPFQGKKMVFDD